MTLRHDTSRALLILGRCRALGAAQGERVAGGSLQGFEAPSVTARGARIGVVHRGLDALDRHPGLLGVDGEGVAQPVGMEHHRPDPKISSD